VYRNATPIDCSRHKFRATAGGQENMFVPNKILEEPRAIIDVVLISYELYMLEARFYELNTVVDFFVIMESAYTHRGWKKLRFFKDEFDKEDSRFTPFQDKIIYLDVDQCPHYIQEVHRERQGGRANSAGKDVWGIQGAMRNCLWPMLKPTLVDLSEEALIMMADVDWFPCVDDLRHIRYCKPSPAYGGWRKPFLIKMQKRYEYSLWTPPVATDDVEMFTLNTVGDIRELGKIPDRRVGIAYLRTLGFTAPSFSCGRTCSPWTPTPTRCTVK
jgi:hypothetical protein